MEAHVSDAVRDALAIRRYDRRAGARPMNPRLVLRAVRGEGFDRWALYPDWRAVAGFRSWIPDPPAPLP